MKKFVETGRRMGDRGLNKTQIWSSNVCIVKLSLQDKNQFSVPEQQIQINYTLQKLITY